VLTDVPEWKITGVPAMDNQRPGYSKDIGCFVWTELLVLRDEGNPYALEKMAEGGFEKQRIALQGIS
jgi:hypothetical protein